MASVSEIIKKNQLVSYFVLTFLITWAIFSIPFFYPIHDWINSILLMAIGGAGPAFAAIILSGIGKPGNVEPRTRKRQAVFFIAFLGTVILIILFYPVILATISLPLLVLVILNAIIAAYIISGGLAAREGIRELLGKLYVWKVSVKWYLIALLLGPAIIIFSLILCYQNAGISLDKVINRWSLGVLYTAIISFSYVTLVRGPLREEIGWRGFALPRLQSRYSPLVATLILGVIWTVWHLPLHLNGIYGGGLGAFIERFYYNIGLTFIITWIYNHTRGSLLLATLFHSSYNSTNTVFPVPEVTEGPFILMMSILTDIAAIVVIFADKMWHKLPKDHEAVYIFKN